jgi:DNA-binding CsgD family transcriptional regulator
MMSLQDLGLSETHELLYRLAIERPTMSLRQVCEFTGLSEDEARQALADLVDFGLAVAAPLHPWGIRLVNVLVGLGQLIETVEDRLLRQQRRVADARAVALELARVQSCATATSQASPVGIEQILHLPDVHERLDELYFFARDSVFAIHPDGPKPTVALNAGRPVDQRSLRRGLLIRTVYEHAVLDDEVNRAYLDELTADGAHLRLNKSRLERLIIVDSKIAVVPIDPRRASRGVLVIREAGLVNNLLKVFDTTWNESDPVPWAEVAEDSDVSDEDRRILTLLAAGCTDETAARQLGVSVRHLRRRVARLMGLLEASSRFEAGAEAAHRRWI